MDRRPEKSEAMSDLAVARSGAERDAAALDALGRRHGSTVTLVAESILNDPDAAEDAATAVFSDFRPTVRASRF